MAKENIDSWKWVTDFEPTFGLDFGEEEVFEPNVNKQNTFKKHESTRPTKRFASLPNEEMHTLLAKKKKHSVETKRTTNWSIGQSKSLELFVYVRRK